MLVELRTRIHLDGRLYVAGNQVDVADADAKDLIRKRLADEVPTTTATAGKPSEPEGE